MCSFFCSFVLFSLNLTHLEGKANGPKMRRFFNGFTVHPSFSQASGLEKQQMSLLHASAHVGNFIGAEWAQVQPLEPSCTHSCQHAAICCGVVHHTLGIGLLQAVSCHPLGDGGTCPACSLEKSMSLSFPKRKNREELALNNSRMSSGGPEDNWRDEFTS